MTEFNDGQGGLVDSFVLPRYDFPRAGRALATLLRDPDDLPQVFTLIDSLSGTAPHRLLRGLRKTESGRRMLRDRPDIAPLLSDRERLRAMPAGSLGRAYLAFVESEWISAEGIKTASEGRVGVSGSRDFAFIHQRMRDTHDLWHAATGYKGDVVGELSLLAFTLAQNWNTAVALLVAAAFLKGFGRTETDVIRDGYRRGKRAAWLPATEWEELLERPLGEVRSRLGLGAPAEYTPVRTTDLKAMGLI
ncbi:MAG: Coq4 family protein [Polyangiaceae bacterium]